MKIRVIGSGGIGGTVGTLWAKAGHRRQETHRDACATVDAAHRSRG